MLDKSADGPTSVTVNMEYVTDAVLYAPPLRCPACGFRVRQIREAPPANGWWVVLGEPAIWAIVGLGGLFGVVWQTLYALAFALVVGTPVLLVWMYLRRLRTAQFLCKGCGGQFSFAEVRGVKGFGG
jgi:hypothetical protein